MTLDEGGRLGIGKEPTQYRLEINGQASKSSPGDWLANSDARLKNNIIPLNASTTFDKLLSLQGLTYEWKDDRQYNRPVGKQFGLTAQNVQAVYPELVTQDDDGWLSTSYGTFDPMFVVAFKELNAQVIDLKSSNMQLQKRLTSIEKLLAHTSSELPKINEK